MTFRINPEQEIGLSCPRSIQPFTDLVNSYYQGLNCPCSTAGRLYSHPDTVNIDSDPERAMESLLPMAKGPINQILTVVAANAPGWFRSQYPKAKINAFDINPGQLERCSRKGKDQPDNVFVCDIGIPGQLTDLIALTRPRLLYFSNVWEYLNKEEQLSLFKEMAQFKDSIYYLFTKLHPGIDFPSYQPQINQTEIWEQVRALGFEQEFQIDFNSGKSAHLLHT